MEKLIKKETRKRILASCIIAIVSVGVIVGLLSGNSGTSSFDQPVANELMIYALNDKVEILEEESHKSLNRTGWAQYSDTEYEVGTELALADGVSTTLPNNAGLIIDDQKPLDIDSFYNRTDTLVIGRDGDGMAVMIDFFVKPTSAMDTRVVTGIDIGGTIGEIFGRDFILSKGNGVTHHFLTSVTAYTAATWEANGGKIKVMAVGGPIEIWDIRYVFTRTHKARN